MQQVPQAASLWVMACQDPGRPSSVLSLQHRQAARKAAKLGALPAQQSSQTFLPACSSSSALSAAEVSAARPTAQPFTAAPRDAAYIGAQLERTGVVDLTGSQKETVRSKRGTAEHPTASATESRKHEARNCVGRAGAAPDSQKALRVQSLRQELAAAEGVVSELKAWLVDAEAELEAEGR